MSRVNSVYRSSAGGTHGVRYPSPFFDVAQQFLPDNQHLLHKWCRYYFLTNPIINAACSKMAEYPVTSIVYDTEDGDLQKIYQQLESMLRLWQFQVEVGLDYFVYGNSFVSVSFKATKYIQCSKCKESYRLERSRHLYKWQNMKFILKCSKCGHSGKAGEYDRYFRNARNIKLIRWNPENISVKHNEAVGHTDYFLRIPKTIVNDVRLGDRFTIENLPKEFLDAARHNKALLFHRDNIYHLKRPTLAQKDQGWGTPLLYPVLKDAFHLQVMKKAQEQVLMEHIVPFRMLFPSQNIPVPGGPLGNINMEGLKQYINNEVNMWKRDNNYIVVSPLPMGMQQFGGQAKGLLMHQEIRLYAEQMLVGMSVPPEFVFGGLQWQGSNTSLTALKNMLMGYNLQRHELVDKFILKKVARFLELPTVNSHFEKFKMADDLQRSMFYLQLNQAQKISDRRLLEEVGEDFDLENQRMADELKVQVTTNRKMQVATADISGEASLKQSRYAAKAQAIQMKAQMETQMALQQEQQQQMAKQQQAGMQPQQPQQAQQAPQQQQQQDPTASMQSGLQQGQGGLDAGMVAKKAVAYLRSVKNSSGDEAMYQELNKLQQTNPVVYQMAVQMLNNKGEQAEPLDAQANPNPTPQASPGNNVVT